MVPYPHLAGEITKRGIKKKVIADSIGVSGKTLYNKLDGKSQFTWPEVRIIWQNFFPDLDPDYLFCRKE